ncbi:hypothetical protein [Aquibacillus saliphilus]|uniref:hypothetical protein n=1 Tax=Aquibacillus saliphilus TaxID=1909422 RepID=UPI001CF08939|nr:hypothetical protein [Aquibacillus saliphilus]
MLRKNSIIILLATIGTLFLFSPVASAHEGDDCGCGEGVREITGSEKNKIVANLLSSDEFKEKKKELKKIGYHWNGVNEVEVEFSEPLNEILIAIPFLNQDRSEKYYWLYAFGEFVGPVPK